VHVIAGDRSVDAVAADVAEQARDFLGVRRG